MIRLFAGAVAALFITSSAYAESIVLQCGTGANVKVLKLDTDKKDGVDVLLDHYLAVAVSDAEFRIADLTEDNSGKTIKYRILRTDGSLYEGSARTPTSSCTKNPTNKF